jgi:hypothetical protein
MMVARALSKPICVNEDGVTQIAKRYGEMLCALRLRS